MYRQKPRYYLVFDVFRTCADNVFRRVSLSDLLEKRAFRGVSGPPNSAPWHDLGGAPREQVNRVEIRSPVTRSLNPEYKLKSTTFAKHPDAHEQLDDSPYV